MNPEEFDAWLKKQTKGGGINNLPQPPQNDFWESVFCDMEPHYYGTMPTSILEAFPNETNNQHQYRCNIHRSLTKPRLWQGMADVKRALMGDGYSVEVGEDMRVYLKDARFGFEKIGFEDYMWDVAYNRRVLDPNALLAVLPKPTPEDLTKDLVLKLRIFASQDICFFSKELLVLKDRKQNKYTNAYFILTRTTVLYNFTTTKKENGTTNTTSQTIQIYQHNNDNLGALPLGGKLIMVQDPKTGQEYHIFEGDFSSAVPAMDKLERLENQLSSSTLNTVFPLRVMKGLECMICEGEGTVAEQRYREPVTGEVKSEDWYYENGWMFDEQTGKYYKTEHIECKQCKGKGTLSLSPLDGILIAPPAKNPFTDDDTAQGATGNIANEYIGFASPPVDGIKEVREQKNEAIGEVDESLNLTKPSKFAESGVSKEKDREGKYTTLKDISDSMSRLIWGTLRTMAQYRFIDSNQQKEELDAIMVIPPNNFSIKTAGEVEAELFANLEKKPDSLRYRQHKEYISKRFKKGDEINLVDDLANKYTNGLYLKTLDELIKMEGVGYIDNNDVRKSLRVFSVAQKVVKAATDEATEEMLLREIDKEMQQFLDLTTPTIRPTEPPNPEI